MIVMEAVQWECAECNTTCIAWSNEDLSVMIEKHKAEHTPQSASDVE